MIIKPMKSEPRLIISSLLAPIATLLIPALLALITILADSSISNSNHNDDAPVRAAGLLLVGLLPFLYLVMVVFMAAVGSILKNLQKLSLRNLLIVYGIVGIPIAIGFGWPSPFGLKDRIIGLMIFFPLTMLCLGIGAVSWWYLAMVWHNKRASLDA